MLAPLLAILNAARGNGSISHWQYCVLVIVACGLLSPQPILTIYIMLSLTLLPTGSLFTQDSESWLYGGFRACVAVIPAFVITHDPKYLVLLLHGAIYDGCLKVNQTNGVRIAEYISGALIGFLNYNAVTV